MPSHVRDRTPGGPATPPLAVTAVDSISEVPASTWDAVVDAGDFYHSWRWLRCAEEVTDAPVPAVLVRAGGRLVAAQPCWLTTGGESAFYDPTRVLAQVGLPAGRYLVAATRKAYTGGLLLADPELAGAVVPLVVDQLRRLADERGARGCVALYAGAAQAARYGAVLGGRRPVLHNAEAVMPLPASFDEFPVHASGHRRARLRREWRHFQGAGFDLAAEHLGDCAEELVPLVANLEHKYGHELDQDDLLRGLRAQVRHCGEADVVFTARRDGRLCAACLCYRHGDTLFVRMFGVDYAGTAGTFAYFGVTYYLPARYAVERGMRTLHLGIEAPGAKVARGCVLEPLGGVDLREKPLWTDPAARTATAARAADFADHLDPERLHAPLGGADQPDRETPE